jgi:hypothetical protein
MNRLGRLRKSGGRRVFLFVVAAIALTVAPATAQMGIIGPGLGPPPLAIWAGTSNNTWTGPAPLQVDFSV